MSPETTGRFGERLNLALKTVNLSPAGLGAAVGVDKSVVSRWLAGKVRPSGHNLTRIAIEIARHRPGFTTLAFDGPDGAFLQALNLAPPLAPPLATSLDAAALPHASALPVPYDLVNTPGSIMPAYPWLGENKLRTAYTTAKIRAMRKIGVPYPEGYEADAVKDLEAQAAIIAKDLNDNGVPVNGDEEIIAIISYLQRVGTDIKKSQTVNAN